MQPHFLVTGANGFLGNHLIGQLLARGYRVLGLILEDNTWSLAQTDDRLQLRQVDLTDRTRLAAIFQELANPELIVIHTAGIISIASKVESILERVNVGATRHVLDLCQRYRVKRLVYVSSVHAIPELPNNQFMTEIKQFDPKKVVGGYAQTKAQASQLVVDARAMGLDTVIVHPSGMLGPGDYGAGSIKQVLLDYLNKKLNFIVAGGYDFVDVRDVATAIIEASLLPTAKNQNYILSNRYFSMLDIIRLVDQLYPERQHRLRLLPSWCLNIVAATAEIWASLRRVPPTLTRYSVQALKSNANFSHHKATTELGYRPRLMQKTIYDTVEWYKEQQLIKEKGKHVTN